MTTYRESIIIEAPPMHVFQVVGDIKRMTEMDHGVKKVEILSEIQEGLGLITRWTQERDDQIFVWEEEIKEWDPPHRIGFEITTPDRRTEGTHVLKSLRDGTATELTFFETYHYSRSAESAHKFMRYLISRVKTISETDMKQKMK